jgi:MFS family permease
MHDQESPENLPDEPAKKDVPADESAYAVLRNTDFFRYLVGRFVASLGQQMLVVAIDWELYDRTHSALPLALVGLSQMVPMILCTLPAGHFADTFSRKKIILITTLVLAAASLGLTCSRNSWPRLAGSIFSSSSSAPPGRFCGQPAPPLSPPWCHASSSPGR